MFVERMTQLDIRVSKLFRLNTTRTSVNFDFYNVLNSNSVISENVTYGAAWRTPQVVLLPRILRSARSSISSMERPLSSDRERFSSSITPRSPAPGLSSYPGAGRC